MSRFYLRQPNLFHCVFFNRKCFVTILFLITFSTLETVAQIGNKIIEAEQDGLGHLNQRIKQIDEFIERFNDTLQPIEYLIDDSLIVSDTLLHKNFLAQAQQSQLSFFDTTWCAQLNVELLYKGETHNAKLYLKVQSYPAEQSSKWVFTAVDANFLSLKPECVDSTTFIPPSANGTNFIAIEKVLKNQANVAAYTKATYKNDQLSIFLFLIKNGDLTLQSIKDQCYYFWQTADYVFQCEYLNRANNNSGWLITAIEPKAVSKKPH